MVYSYQDDKKEMVKVTALFFGLLGALFAYSVIAASPVGTVIGITDGDTITVMGEDHQPFKVRLADIDAPEGSQPYGKQSKKALSALIYKKTVRLEGDKVDRYGRRIARVYLDDLDVCAAMVEQGAAWVYRRYTKNPILYKAEAAAKADRRGLWKMKDPLPPWTWRHNR